MCRPWAGYSPALSFSIAALAAFCSAAQTAAGSLGPPFLSICPGGVNPPGIKILLHKMLDAADAAARFRSQKRRSGRLFPSL